MIYNFCRPIARPCLILALNFVIFIAKHDFIIKLLIYFKSNFYRLIAKSDIIII